MPRLLCIALCMALLPPGSLLADHIPGHAKFKWGLGLAALSHPDYRGSSYTQSALLPLPYIRYRGERLRVEDGIEGRLFKSPDLLLTISGNGSPPSDKNNPERAGMDQLDATMEIGPSLEYRVSHDDDSSLWFELPLRYAFNLEKSLDRVGRVLHPRLAWRWPAQSKYDWKLRFAAGPLFGDDDYLAYHYNVKPGEVTPSRPAYTASSGYTGLRFDYTYSRRIDRLWFGGFVRFDSLGGADIEDSPLVTRSNNLTAGVGMAWVFDEG
jgi:outer membrane protein